jgi:multiple RNA-binding domain-containing protein 1
MKRKRSDVDEADPKLKEFLELMQPTSKSKSWTTRRDDSEIEPPTKMQAVEVPEAESDGEYEVVPKTLRKKSPAKLDLPKQSAVQTDPIPESNVVDPPSATDSITADSYGANATDDDWLRSRTNRLLDLVEPEAIFAAMRDPASADVGVAVQTNEEPVADTDDGEQGPQVVEKVEEKTDAIIEAIKANGRLFVRNLPYTATETDLREHFAAYGSLEEVCMNSRLYFCALCFVMNTR